MVADIQPIPRPEMTTEEARACIEALKRFDSPRHPLLDLYERRGWERLGYPSFTACVSRELGWRRSQAYRHLRAAQTEQQLGLGADGELVGPLRKIGQPHLLRESHLHLIASLPQAERRAIAEALARGELTSSQLHQLARERRDGRRAELSELRPIKPLPELPAGVVQIVQADAADPPFPAGSVDLQITSPPYCLGIRDAEYVDFDDYDAYLEVLPRWASSMYRLAAPWGRLALVVPIDISRPRREMIAGDWHRALREAGWRFRCAIAWKEGNISRSIARGSVDSPQAINVVCPTELVLVFYKGEWNLAPVRLRRPEWARSDLERPEWLEWTMGAWSFAGEKAKRVGGHPAAFPEELPRRLLKLYSFPGSTVGDFWLGSGTTAVAALGLGRRFVGCEISPLWVDYARRRVLDLALPDQVEGGAA